MLLLEVADSNLIFGLPETADVLIFGLALIFFTIGMRRVFRSEKRKSDN